MIGIYDLMPIFPPTAKVMLSILLPCLFVFLRLSLIQSASNVLKKKTVYIYDWIFGENAA